MCFKGLLKIAEASTTLSELNEILVVQRVKVADQTKNCEQLLASNRREHGYCVGKEAVERGKETRNRRSESNYY